MREVSQRDEPEVRAGRRGGVERSPVEGVRPGADVERPPVEGVRPSALESAAAIGARIRADLHEGAEGGADEDLWASEDTGRGLVHDVRQALLEARVGVAVDVEMPEHGVIVLHGVAPSDLVRLHIEDVAGAVPGVELVHNEVAVVT